MSQDIFDEKLDVHRREAISRDDFFFVWIRICRSNDLRYKTNKEIYDGEHSSKSHVNQIKKGVLALNSE